MEESEKRKERLKAMRTAAAEAESIDNNGTLPGPSYLSNPLNESSGPQPVQEESGASSRFDFYTNPMAAFSGNKRTNAANPTQQNYPTFNHGPQSNKKFPAPSGPRNFESSPSSAHQWQPSLNQKQHQPHNLQQNFTHYQNPRGNFHPYPVNAGFPPQGWIRPDGPPSFNHPPNPPRGYNMPSPPPYGNPNFPRSPGFTTPSPSYSGHPNFTPRHGGSQWRGNFQGQGRGQSFGRNLGGSGRGSGSAQSWGPERFYDKSMVEDPWKHLSPVIWTPIESPLTNSGAWIPHSIRSKKPKVQNSLNKFSGGSSLAEFLAASFNDTVNENEKEPEDG